jgi:glycosyltransferase involved in cell wall biosynthesis
VISTYDRGPFVRENVRWLLKKIVRPGSGFDLWVVDNASNDDTARLLSEFAGAPGFHLVRNPANVGMLGNLAVCAALTGAEYVWLTGDDDYLVPGEAEAVRSALRTEAGVPFAFTNFGVYSRAAFGPADSAAQFIREQSPLSRNPRPSGLCSVVAAAEQHDNLFTAIYPLVWRADVLSAAFNHPFDGPLFADLVHAVPTTATILGSYAEADCYWHAPVAVVGNARNSWEGRRRRWHSVLMPRVLELAREAGVDARLLQQWAEAHRHLYLEALGHPGVPSGEPTDEDVERAQRVFRGRLPLAETAGES